jgi:hypothetical protein
MLSELIRNFPSKYVPNGENFKFNEEELFPTIPDAKKFIFLNKENTEELGFFIWADEDDNIIFGFHVAEKMNSGWYYGEDVRVRLSDKYREEILSISEIITSHLNLYLEEYDEFRLQCMLNVMIKNEVKEFFETKET